MMMTFETIIGLEIHVQILTQSKAFCSDANQYTKTPNQNIGVISLAHPGALPKMNVSHLEKAILLSLALESNINTISYFDRKNYYYPDLPKGYQITQDNAPYCTGGSVNFMSEGEKKSIRLHHIHIEEDAGKSIHDMNDDYSYVDYNRAGVPLLEIVTEPDFRSGQEVSDFLAELQKIVQYLNISDGNMEEGSFRCDCNVSVRNVGQPLGERCEIKNMNSRKFAKNAIEYEANRQISIIENGGIISRSTMLYDPIKNETRPMRKKEAVNDYRYFPEPDLPPVVINEDIITKVKNQLVALPFQRYIQLTEDFHLSHADAEFLIDDIKYIELFLGLATHCDAYKDLADLLINKAIPWLKAENLDVWHDPKPILQFIDLLQNGKVSKSAAYQHIFPEWIEDIRQDPLQIAMNKQLVISENQDFLDDEIKKILASYPDKVKEYQKGKKGLIGFFMGQVIQKTGGKTDPKILQAKIEKALVNEI